MRCRLRGMRSTSQCFAEHETLLEEVAEYEFHLEEDIDLYAKSKILYLVRFNLQEKDFALVEQHLKTAVAFGMQSAELADVAERLHNYAQAGAMAQFLRSSMEDT